MSMGAHKVSPETTKIGFIGCGVMGSSMISNLLEAGYDVTVSTRTASKAEGVIAKGAHWAETRADAIVDKDVVITIVGYPADVEEVYMDKDGILDLAKEGAYVIDMTTSSPALARDIATSAEVRGLHALDAPVSGGDLGAKNGTLTIMVGGEQNDFDAVQPIFEVLGSLAVLQGDAGAGQNTKMANQIALAGAIVGTVEALSYARDMGLDPARVLESIAAGSGGSWQLANMGPRILADDLEPGFFSKHFLKDLAIAIEAADAAGVMYPGLETAAELYATLNRVGGENLGTQGLFLLYADEEVCLAHGLDLTQLDESDHGHEHGDDCGCGHDHGRHGHSHEHHAHADHHNPDIFTGSIEFGGFGNDGIDPSNPAGFSSFFNEN